MSPRDAPRPAVRVAAVLMGFPCAVLVLLLVDIVRSNPRWDDSPSGLTLIFVFLLGWGFATWLLRRRAEGVLTVLQRGFLFGAAGWLIVALLVPILGRVAAPASVSGSLGARASWEPAAPDLTSGVAAVGFMDSAMTALAALCLTAWAVTYLASRALQRRAAIRVASARPAAPR